MLLPFTDFSFYGFFIAGALCIIAALIALAIWRQAKPAMALGVSR